MHRPPIRSLQLAIALSAGLFVQTRAEARSRFV